ncbi:hypothetical protein [Massilia rhizosphaerae]|uniref:hypothetical protein n=1 Tax=Massilia rhizosphaerae TaxID=2784389 RepID=UPI0018DD91F4|nr:hypothetical protein [Massilia rhizosphaerae]
MSPAEPFPPALDTLEAVAGYLADAFDAGDPDTMTQALARVARAPGLAHLAAAAGLPRELLAASMNRGEMGLDTLLAIMKVIDQNSQDDFSPDS